MKKLISMHRGFLPVLLLAYFLPFIFIHPYPYETDTVYLILKHMHSGHKRFHRKI